MFKSKLYWKVLANFALLLVILTAMTLLTLNILSQIEKNFVIASKDTRLLSELDEIRGFLSDVPAAAFSYAFTGSSSARDAYQNGWKGFDEPYNVALKELTDSSSVKSMRGIRDLYFAWMQNIGDKLVSLRDRNLKGSELEAELRKSVELETQIQYIASARRLLRDLNQRRLASQPASIERAASMSRDLALFISLINILLAVFALALGFVLTRSITNPIRILKQGTQNITEGKFESISLNRTDELGDLAVAFNQMSSMLGSNYTRLKAYSDLVSTLNTLEAIGEVESRSLQLLCTHTGASVGALYLLEKETEVLELVSGYALKGNLQRTLKMGEGIPGQCAAEQKILEITDISPSSEFLIDTGLFEVPPKCLLAVPIIFQDKVIGVIVLGSTRSFNESDKEIINNSVPQIGVALRNAISDDATRKLSLEIAKRNEELNSKNSELEKLYKVKSAFLASMSHELRTPLNSIIGFSSVLVGPNGEPMTRDQRMAVEKVLKNGKHLLQLINDILDLSKLESGRMTVSVETEDIHSLISNCMMTVEPLVKSKNITLTHDITPNLPPLKTDVVKVKQILVNLLSNATKFTEQGGITIKVWQEGDKMLFAVKDSGIGIEKKNLNLVFEEFQQVDSGNNRKYKGTGLGLPISRRLARILGGDLTVDSEFGNGSTFTLVIPHVYIPGPEEKTQVMKPTPEPIQQFVMSQPGPTLIKGSNILCIDDDPDVIEILRKYLVPEGYSVTGALSGDEGVSLATRLKPALITLDIMMPKKDGWQVLRELKQSSSTRDIPVIIHSIVENKPLAMSLGAVDVMTKPTDPTKLLSLVKRFCKSSDQSILIVDDNEDFALAMKNLMGNGGFTVRIANGGKKALELLKTSTPALMFLDLMMPDMDGFEVVGELQKNEQWKKIPIVILSGKELSDDEFKRLGSHITEYMKKDDISTLDISSAIKRILNIQS